MSSVETLDYFLRPVTDPFGLRGGASGDSEITRITDDDFRGNGRGQWVILRRSAFASTRHSPDCLPNSGPRTHPNPEEL